MSTFNETDELLKYIHENIDSFSDEEAIQIMESLEQIKQMTLIESARTNFLDFVRLCGQPGLVFSSRGQHHQVAKIFEDMTFRDQKRVTISMPPRFSKALSVDEVVPTPSGWSRMGELKVGDSVFGPDGSITKITNVSPIWKDRPLYRVFSNTGNDVICDENHEWEVRLCRKRKVKSIRTAKYLFDRKLKNSDKRNPMVEINGCLDTNESSLPIPPYTLGAWLGDGHSDAGRITQCGTCTKEVLEGIENDGFTLSQNSDPKNYGILGLQILLRDNNLLGNKHIPISYLRSSRDNRLSLLRGILDTDGSCSNTTGMWSITSVKKELAEGYKELVVSLGIKCSILEDTATLYGKDCGQCWTVFFFMKNASSVKYKNDNSKFGEIRPNHYIDIEEFGVGDTVCIEVDHPSHLYLAGKGMIPTHNSTFGSICLPAFYLGNHPNQKIIQGSAVDERATEFGRQVKAIIDSDIYKRIFPGVYLTKDSKSKGRFATNHGGTYYAVGATTSIQGIGADLFILDDIVGEKEAAAGDIESFDKAWEWYFKGPLQRIQPGGRILHIATRWSKADPIGRVKALAKADKKADQFLSIEFPALDENEESTFPEFWTTEMLVSKKHQFFASGRLDLWEAQFQQSPILMEGSIIPSSKWRKWDKSEPVKGSDGEVDFIPPDIEYLVMALDTSYTKTNRADPSAMVLLGVFEYKDEDKKEKYNAVILLHSAEIKLEYPELKRKIIEWQKDYSPDVTLIEDKGSGSILLQDMRRAGISVTAARVKGTEDKITRLNSVADLFHSGLVFYIPTTQNHRVLLQANDFPATEHDDLTDALAHGIRHLKKGGSIILPIEKRISGDDVYMPPSEGFY